MPLHRFLLGATLCALTAATAEAHGANGTRFKSVPLNLTAYYNNKGFGTYPGEASFDTLNQSYPAPDFDTGTYASPQTGITYAFPGYTGPSAGDNVICAGQTIAVPAGRYFSASFLVAGDVELATVTGNATFHYAPASSHSNTSSSSSSAYELLTPDWYSFLTINRGQLIFPRRWTAAAADGNASHIFERTAPLVPGRTLTAVTLPNTTDADAGRMHVFAISLWSAGGGDGGVADVAVQTVRPTQKWLDDNDDDDEPAVQVVEVTLNHGGGGAAPCVAGAGLHVSLAGDGLRVAKAGRVKRLCPGDQKTVTVGVESAGAGPRNVTVVVEGGGEGTTAAQEFAFTDVEFGLTAWTEDLDNLARHESPAWFDDAKFGIFVHWGPYSVTGWGNSSPHESYAEWFWWYSTHHPQADPSDFYDYRLRTYGPEWAYDDTFRDFTASAWDPKAWVDLFADAGATYFVLTSKHHDGFALFDAGPTSNRTSLHHGPRRDLVGELFAAAAAHQPHLRRGTYFSLPEWFNPDYGPYGFDQFDPAQVPATNSWPGVLARNPYTGAAEPYTGRVEPAADFLQDVMLPQMRTLALDPRYAVDLMWCDCGAANATAAFAAAWWNHHHHHDATTTAGKGKRKGKKQVAINSRCGLAQAADFDTPEYATWGAAQRRKWESSSGLDPYSYGYNRATPAAAYLNATALVRRLADVVAKNGNLLIDVGPRADGSIVQAEVDTLRGAGVWIRAHGEAIFNTTYWFVQSEVAAGPDVRFTQTDAAFYMLFLERPKVDAGVVSIPAPVPVVDGDAVSLLAVDGGDDLGWSVKGEGRDAVLNIEVDESLLDQEEICWVFKIQYA
ncbi:glycoside hydrolase family 29 protein [Xylariomycetidae sp. FL0641]|nr:glycoside hydrolase family 29 protein [Xylariomycetidae sp. FL0641]